MTVVALSNRKGGTGKTTTATNLAACLAELNKSVLLIDLDPQANATSSVGVDKANMDTGAVALLTSDKKLKDLIQTTDFDNLSVVPGGSDLAVLDLELPVTKNWETILVKKIKKNNFDFVVIDTPPALGAISINALVAADGILLPLQCDYLSLEGLQEFATNLYQIRQKLNPKLRLYALVKTMYDNRTLLSRQVADELARHFGQKVLPTAIPRNIKLAEAPSHGQPIVHYAPSSTGAKAYRAMTKEFLKLL